MGAGMVSGSGRRSTGPVVSLKSSAEPASETRLNTGGHWLWDRGLRGGFALDHGFGQGPVGVGALGAARVLQDGHPGQRRLGKSDAVLDHDVEDGVAVALADELQHLLRVQGARLVDGGQDANDVERRVEL